ncbi:3-oxoacyl-[acyl-carrier-protein] reductase FabG [subsurface metagenome]
MFSLLNRIAIVTGAGSKRGIGRAIALGLARQGADIIVCDINLDGAKKIAKEIEKEGRKALALGCNVISEEDIKKVIEIALREFKKVDILVNNAGITQPVKVFDITKEDWDRIMNVNLRGTFLFSKAVLPVMMDKNYGRIINISSVSAKNGGGVFGGAHYCASKAGILAFTKVLAKEVSPLGITVNSISPGLVATDIRGGLENEEEQKKMSINIPCRRLGLPEEIAAAVCFLASKEAAYVTGGDIDVNGGIYMN